MVEKLAKISSAALKIKERGILNFWIHVNYEDDLCQGVGGIALDKYDKEKERRVGTAYGCELIRRVLVELNVNDFSEMKDKVIWVIGEGDSFSFTPTGIRSLYVNNKNSNPVIFKDIANEFIRENKDE